MNSTAIRFCDGSLGILNTFLVFIGYGNLDITIKTHRMTTLNTISWITLGTGIGLAIAAIILLVRGPRPTASKHVAPARRQAGQPVISRAIPRSYPGVAIRPHPTACGSAWEQKGQRYLTNEVPVLPLKGCDRTTCQCEYAEYSDRRDGKARRATYVTATGLDTDVSDDQRETGFDRRFH